MWQCVIDVVVKDQLLLPSTSATQPTRKLTSIEENAIRYTAGFVIKKMLDRCTCSKDSDKRLCLTGLLTCDDEDVHHSESELWLNKTDRGYLKHINDIAHEFFVELEICTYDILMQTTCTSTKLETLYNAVLKDDDVLRIWKICTMDVHDDVQQLLLEEIIKEWIKVRGHSIADMRLEQHKKNKATVVTKKKGVRKELKRAIKTKK